MSSLWKKKKLSKDEFDKKCLCGHAKSSHHCSGCAYCESCEFYEAQEEFEALTKGDGR